MAVNISAPTRIGGTNPDITGVSSTVITTVVMAAVGDLIIIAGGFGLGATSTPSAVDSAGNTYTLRRLEEKTTNQTPHAYELSAVVTTKLPSGGTITVSFSTAVNRPITHVYKISVTGGTWSADQNNGATGASTSPASGNVTTTLANSLLFSAICFGLATTGAGFTAGAGWTPIDAQTNTTKSEINQYRIETATGTFNSTGTITSDDWADALVSYGVTPGAMFNNRGTRPHPFQPGIAR